MSQGISVRHGAHHVAQKFTRTTFPLYRLIVTGPPSRLGICTVVSGAAAAATPAVSFEVWRWAPEPQPIKVSSTATPITFASFRNLLLTCRDSLFDKSVQ